MNRAIAWLALSTVALTATAAPTAPPIALQKPVLTMHVDSRVVIGKDGTIVKYEPDGKLPPQLADRFNAMVRALAFEPVLVDGKPVNADVRMRTTLAADDLGDGNYRVVVDNVTFPDNRVPGAVEADAAHDEPVRLTATSRRNPVYPSGVLRYGLEANVMATVRVAPDGRVAEVAATQSSLLNTRGRDDDMASAIRLFEAETLRALRSWKFRVETPPGVTPDAKNMSGSIMVSYRIGANSVTDKTGRWTLEVRTARRDPTWLPPSVEGVVGVSDLNEGEIASLDSPVRLKTPIKGAVL